MKNEQANLSRKEPSTELISETFFLISESVSYDYYPTSGLPRQVEVANAETGFRMLAEHKYHIGLLKESRISYFEENMDRIVLNYQYDGSARIAGIKVRLGKSDPRPAANAVTQFFHPFKYDSASGQLEAFEDMKVGNLEFYPESHLESNFDPHLEP